MYLERINEPSDLSDLSHEELDVLATEIRAFIVEAVNKNGGHLGSNLGAVELTLALHRAFESPHDTILWDTGHQAYVHKIVTGRRDGFGHLRKEGGLSGYPNRAESEHDVIENSHASTVLSWAHGLTAGRRITNGSDAGHVVAVIGDGSLTGGMAYEGLNNLGHSQSDIIIVLNDNGRSYAPTASNLGDSLARYRSNPVMIERQRRLESFAAGLPLIGRLMDRGIDASKAAIREIWEPPAFFEDLGIRYLGPFNGHDIEAMEQAFENAAQFDGPQLIHVLTQKGRGYAPAEADSVKLMHDTGSIKDGSYTAAFMDSLCKLGELHSDVVAITAAMPDSTGVLAFEERFPERAFDVGIAEQHAVTMAAGMSRAGLTPIFAVYSSFLTRAFDQLNLDVGLHGEHVVFCLDRAGVTGDDGPSHHGVLDMVLCMKVPGMTVMAPSSYQELQVMMVDAVEMCEGPVAIRWPKTRAVIAAEDEVGSGLSARKARSSDGASVCLIGVGKMLETSLEAAELLSAEGIEVTVWDPRVVKPLDEEMLRNAAAHDLVVTVEDGFRQGGVGTAVEMSLRDRGSSVCVEVLGVPIDYYPHANPDVILSRLGLDAEGVARSIEAAVSGEDLA